MKKQREVCDEDEDVDEDYGRNNAISTTEEIQLAVGCEIPSGGNIYTRLFVRPKLVHSNFDQG